MTVDSAAAGPVLPIGGRLHPPTRAIFGRNVYKTKELDLFGGGLTAPPWIRHWIILVHRSNI